jgi:aerobic C4-dicarboxylate transport protein
VGKADKQDGVKKKKFYSSLLFQVSVGIIVGVTLGFVNPDIAKQLKPLGIGFIKMIKMMIGPIIFGTIVVGIAKMGDMKKVGRVGVKALVYFELVTTIALILGLIVVNIVQPGAGLNADPAKMDMKGISAFTTGAKSLSTVDFLMNIIPSSVVDAFAKGEILQILFFSCLFGAALSAMGDKGKAVVHIIDEFTHGMFKGIGYIMRLAPLGAGGAMAFAIGSFGSATLSTLGMLLASVYGTAIFFVIFILGTIAKIAGFSLWKLFKYIKEEFFIVMGTSSSETVLPRIMAKLENAGIQKSVVGLVIPTGYTFNLDGTSIYLTMAAVFIAQAFNINLPISDQITMLLIMLLTSKGAAAVAGGGFICLAATLSAINTGVPVVGLALLLGVDWFMATCRALTNLMGNCVAGVVVARWEDSIDMARFHKVLNNETVVEAESPEQELIEREEKGWAKEKA